MKNVIDRDYQGIKGHTSSRSRVLSSREVGMEEVRRRMDEEALLDGLKQLRWHSGACHHVSVYQRLQLQLLPLSPAKIAPHVVVTAITVIPYQ